MRKNTSGQKIGAQLVSATDGTDVTSGTTTVYVTGDAGTQAAGSVSSGACTHEGNGYWTYAPAQGETNYNLVAFTFKNSSAVTATVQVETESYDVHDTVRLGLTALPNAAADAAGGLPISDAGGLDLDAQVGTKINDILTDTGTTLDGRIPAALVSGRMDSSVGAYQSGMTPLQPTTSGRTLDVSAGGEAGIDWANVGTPGSTVSLSSTTVATVTTTATATTIGSTGIAAIWSYAKASAAALATTTIGRYIYDKLAYITSSTAVTTSSLVSNGDIITIFQGEGRTVAGNNQITLEVPASDPDLTGYTARLGITKITSNSGTSTLEITGSISGQTMTFELTKAQTAALALSTGGTHPFRVNPSTYYAYTWTISAFKSTTECRVFAVGYVDVKTKDTTCA